MILADESKHQEQWKRIQEIWSGPRLLRSGTAGRPQSRARRIAEALEITTTGLASLIKCNGLDKPQTYEAFWSRVGQMIRPKAMAGRPRTSTDPDAERWRQRYVKVDPAKEQAERIEKALAYLKKFPPQSVRPITRADLSTGRSNS